MLEGFLKAENWFKFVFFIAIIVFCIMIIGFFLLFLKIMLSFLPEINILGLTIS